MPPSPAHWLTEVEANKTERERERGGKYLFHFCRFAFCASLWFLDFLFFFSFFFLASEQAQTCTSCLWNSEMFLIRQEIDGQQSPPSPLALSLSPFLSCTWDWQAPKAKVNAQDDWRSRSSRSSRSRCRRRGGDWRLLTGWWFDGYLSDCSVIIETVSVSVAVASSEGASAHLFRCNSKISKCGKVSVGNN